jgi:hypothetical protein
MARILRLVAAALGTALGIWYRAVLALPEVKRRKRARRAAAKAAQS